MGFSFLFAIFSARYMEEVAQWKSASSQMRSQVRVLPFSFFCPRERRFEMSDGKTYLYILVGPPASGKSTLAKSMSEYFDAEVVSPDSIRKDLFGDERCQDDNAKVFEEAFETVKSLNYEYQDVIFDATNVVKWRRMELVERFRMTFDVIVAVCYTGSLERCLYWNKQRERYVPDAVINRMWRQYLEGGYPSMDEGYDMVTTFDLIIEAMNQGDEFEGKPEQEPHVDIHVVERFMWTIDPGPDKTRRVERKILKAFDDISNARSFVENDSRSYEIDMEWTDDNEYSGESPLQGVRYRLYTIPSE